MNLILRRCFLQMREITLKKQEMKIMKIKIVQVDVEV